MQKKPVNIAVVKTVWRRIRRPSTTTIKQIESQKKATK